MHDLCVTIHQIVDDEVPSVVYVVGGVTVGSIGGSHDVPVVIWVVDCTAEGWRFQHLLARIVDIRIECIIVCRVFASQNAVTFAPPL